MADRTHTNSDVPPQFTREQVDYIERTFGKVFYYASIPDSVDSVIRAMSSVTATVVVNDVVNHLRTLCPANPLEENH